MSFKAGVCGMEYHSIDGTGWPDAVVVDNGGDIFEHAYETRTYFPVDRDALLALADEMVEVAKRRRSMGYEGFAIGDEDRARRIREALDNERMTLERGEDDAE